ncbi:hypothetical protein DPEC_G00356250 [Dallia pectoralis]|uniref:Uncharacterized protein n=1 Tax=Dallia pectoralis TaxID=75939 RepID=A0ACC2EZS8_DALPE|nr:hypothetical protein DPEC_G00356250 [Dallia pectoralis]
MAGACLAIVWNWRDNRTHLKTVTYNCAAYEYTHTMKLPKAEDVKRGISVIWDTLQCPICLDLMSTPVSTKCDHQFCKFCMMKLLDRSKRKEACCPVCNSKITKRSLQESPGFLRLVEGLQNLVQAYEQDTSTNYFTGMYQVKSQTSATETVQEKANLDDISDDVWAAGHDNDDDDDDDDEGHDDLPVSCSSTVAAKDGFAKLMGLQDSCAVILDEEFDSSMDDKPSAGEKATNDSKSSIAVTEKQKPALETKIPKIVESAPSQSGNQENKLTPYLTDPPCHLEEVACHPVRRSLRNNKRASSSQTNVLEQRQKQSLEKVSEWLIKNSPEEIPFEKAKNAECSRDSNTGISFPSSPLEENSMNKEQSPTRKERCLEEQVFGAIYKRGRRGNRSFSPQNRQNADPQTPGLMEEEGQIPTKVPRKRMSSELTPADFVKRPRSEVNGDGVINKPEERTVNDMTELTSHRSDQHGEKLNELSEDINGSPVFSVQPRTWARRTRKQMQGKWQDIDGELQVNGRAHLANTRQKRTLKKREDKYSLRSQNNIAAPRPKVPKPLILVGVEEGERDSVAMPQSRPLGQIEVQIESYPSSEDPGCLIVRKTRSQGLIFFTEEGEGSNKMIDTSRAIKVTSPHSDCNEIQRLAMAGEDANVDNVVSLNKLSPEKSLRKNGCVSGEDIGGIEYLLASETTTRKIVKFQKVCPVEKDSIAVVPNTESPLITGSVALVSSPRSLSEAVVQASEPETPASQTKCVHMGSDDRNDSEVDTEQLLKSFKATKRKSFRLGSPSIKNSSFWSGKENATPTKIQTSPNKETEKTQELPNATKGLTFQLESTKGVRYALSNCRDLIPPSSSPNYSSHEAAQSNQGSLSKSIVTGPTQKVIESVNSNACGNTQEVCGGRESVPSSNVVEKIPVGTGHQAVDSGVLFPALGGSEEALLDPTPEASRQRTFSMDGLSYSADDRTWKGSVEAENIHSKEPEIAVETDKRCSVNSTRNVANTESSLTPDDLLPPVAHAVVIQEAERVKESGEGSSLSSVPISLQQRQRRKALRLESSESDSSASEEELPPLGQIFRHSACPTEDESVTLLEDPSREHIRSQEAIADCIWAAANNERHDGSSPRCPSPDCIDTSQASVDLFGTPEDGVSHLSGEGTAGVTGLTQESSQFSNEIIATQQKVAMQEKLQRLQRMMTLVSKALQEKERSSVDRVSPRLPNGPALLHTDDSTGADSQTTTPCAEGTGKRSVDRDCSPDDGRNAASPEPGPDCRGLDPLPARRTKRAGPGENTAGHLSRQSGRTLRSSGRRVLPNRVSTGASGATRHSRTTTPSPTGLEVRDTPSVIQPTNTQKSTRAPQRGPAEVKLVLVGSGLSAPEQSAVRRFARKMGGSVTSQVTSETTHVIMSTDGDLACERTLKYFLGIAGRKWVVSFQWISESFKQGKVLNETQFEVRGDVVNGPDHQGPMRARTTEDESLLMRDFEICFQGPFTDMTTGQMEWMVELCGGTVVKEPRLFTGKRAHQLVVIQPSLHQSSVLNLAPNRKADVIARGWLLDTVATYTLQSLDSYRT